jgi:hypothetical protein
MAFHLARVNIERLRTPIENPRTRLAPIGPA